MPAYQRGRQALELINQPWYQSAAEGDSKGHKSSKHQKVCCLRDLIAVETDKVHWGTADRLTGVCLSPYLEDVLRLFDNLPSH